jgi:hypothetical protein
MFSVRKAFNHIRHGAGYGALIVSLVMFRCVRVRRANPLAFAVGAAVNCCALPPAPEEKTRCNQQKSLVPKHVRKS